MRLRLIILCYCTIFLSRYVCDDTIGYNGMINSGHYLASEAGKSILAKGGTAADASFVIQMVLNVVQPFSSGIGGGSFIMYYDAESDEVIAIDGREEAPAAFNPYVFCSDIKCFNTNGTEGETCSDCEVIPFAERRTGGLSVGVPGTLYAFTRLWELYGKSEDVISWSDLFSDAIDLAQNGFPMYKDYVSAVEYYIPYLSRYESACKLLLNYPNCTQPKYSAGDNAYNEDLAEFYTTLSSMTSTEAIAAFYEGDIASDIVNRVQSATNEVTARSGLITKEDMAGYRAVFREPLTSTFTTSDGQQYDVYGMNMPSSGPLTVQYALKMLQYLNQSNLNDDAHNADTLHYLFAASNIAFADRNQYMADSDFVNVPVDGLLDEEYLKQRANDYLTDKVQKLPVPFGYPQGWNDSAQAETTEEGTAHFTVADAYGNVASITTTIESGFGSFVVLDGYGFFLNNELTDFSAKGVVNGVSVANGAQGGKVKRSTAINLFDLQDADSFGGKRPRSSMSPTIILKDNVPYIAVGARGGSFIIGTVFNIIVRHLEDGISIQEAVDSAKVWGVNIESVLFEKELWEGSNPNITHQMMKRFGYNETVFVERSYGSASAIVIADDHTIHCGVDRARRSTAGCAAVCTALKSSCILSVTTQTPTKHAKDGNNTWIVVAIVFICLFGISLVMIVVMGCRSRTYKEQHKENETAAGIETTSLKITQVTET